MPWLNEAAAKSFSILMTRASSLSGADRSSGSSRCDPVVAAEHIDGAAAASKNHRCFLNLTYPSSAANSISLAKIDGVGRDWPPYPRALAIGRGFGRATALFRDR